MNEYTLVCDPAKKRDFFAIMCIRTEAEVIDGNKVLETSDKVINTHTISLIEQYQGLQYEEMADRIYTIMQNPKLRLNTDLLCDQTGIGEAVVELLRKRGLYPIPIIFSGGETAKEHHTEMNQIFNNTGSLQGAKVLKNISIPKKDLVAAGKIMFEQGRLKLAPGKWKETFKKQLMNFKGKVNEKTGNVKYEAEDEFIHDDLICCYLMASWYILNRKDKGVQERRADQQETLEYDPLEYC